MAYLLQDFLGVPAWFWLAFIAVVAAVLIIDLGFLNRKASIQTLKQSTVMVSIVMILALSFAGFIWYEMGEEKASLFLTAFILEQSLSIDNVFVISVIFSYFAVPRAYQHHVLFWGILLAMVFRAIFIGAGTAIIIHFEWLLWVFAAFLIYSGYKMFKDAGEEPDIANNAAVKFLSKHLYVTDKFDGEKFFIKLPSPKNPEKLIRYATPVFLAFLVINIADIVFAVDSVPAVLSLTRDPFIVYTSNIFAILGLRSLYFVINALIATFHYLTHALSVLLVFIGGKIIWDHLVAPLDPGVTLAITVAILATAIVASILRKKELEKKA